MFGRKSRLERTLDALNPNASSPSTADRERAARAQQREDRKAAARRSGHRDSINSGRARGRWPW
ncbi:hypothetical protein [Streptomyces fructofermentans]|uniref:Uncharacterized protein n=1 Tax=Streptomyces fructofermentans TaxID=152141 RepID=A0A918NV86_9ACTN|nr:hypothetical protein [Streptomyces fructofermentans]GGX99191.1 hypothetical protein GCM10010515_76720 [Streptomyces fructofermentans]